MNTLSYFTPRQTIIGKLSNLMGTPLRAAIIECLAKNKDCFDAEFISKHQVSITILKKNLRALIKGGLVIRYSVGRNKANIYKVNWEKLAEFKLIFDDLYYDIREFRDKDVVKGVNNF
jgi:hypothetical protein